MTLIVNEFPSSWIPPYGKEQVINNASKNFKLVTEHSGSLDYIETSQQLLLMHQFLMEKGYRKESKRLIESIKQLIEKSGFREYYNPFTGEGYGAKDFTWAGLIVDMINMEKGANAVENRLNGKN